MRVKDLYNLCQEQEIPTKLLTSFAPLTEDFWQSYRENYLYLDIYFKRLYSSMKYVFYDEDATDEENLENWLVDVRNVLFTNAKKYWELWRIQTIADNKLSMTDNYNMKETTTGTIGNSFSETLGSRSDSGSITTGAQTNTEQDQVNAFNSSTAVNSANTSQTIGSRSDSTSNTIGQQSNSSTSTDTHNMTVDRVGNLGIQTGADVLKSYKNAIDTDVFDFYHKVFNDIAKELLIWGD